MPRSFSIKTCLFHFSLLLIHQGYQYLLSLILYSLNRSYFHISLIQVPPNINFSLYFKIITFPFHFSLMLIYYAFQHILPNKQSLNFPYFSLINFAIHWFLDIFQLAPFSFISLSFHHVFQYLLSFTFYLINSSSFFHIPL